MGENKDKIGKAWYLSMRVLRLRPIFQKKETKIKYFIFAFHGKMQEVRVALPNVVHVVRLYSLSGK